MKPFAALLLWLAAAHALAAEPPARPRLEQANAALAQAWRSADAAALAARYRDDALLMPEHAPAQRGAVATAGYQQQWLQRSRTLGYERRIHDVLDYGDRAVETGTVRHEYARPGLAPYTYAGKYLVVWDMQGAAPKVLAELWSADAAFDKAVLPALGEAPTPTAAPAFDNDRQIARALDERNALIRRLVMERKGSEHAALFLPGAVYLPYYTPMQVGGEAIHGYFAEHERPGPVSIDALDLRSGRIHPLDGGRLQLEEGFYRVAWRAGADSGTVHGKSLNLWQRDDDGTWHLLRQAVNHD